MERCFGLKGTQFFCWNPVGQNPDAIVEANPPTARPPRILHLEDGEADAEFIRRSLAAGIAGVEIAWVKDAAGFSERLTNGRFDLLLLDYNLPSFTGLEALRMARKESPGTPAIMVSGSLGEEMAAECLKAGATDYVPKSKLARLVSAVERALREVGERDARRLTGEALLASEDHYRLLFDHSPTPIMLYEQETLAFLDVNEAALGHYGLSREEFLAMTLKDIALTEEIPAFVKKLSNLTPEAGNSGIWRHRKKDGKHSEMEITSYPAVFEGKRAWLSLAVDVTERLSLEAQLRQSQKMESVGRLAGGIAHDFNNMLTVINGHTSLLLTMSDLSPKVAEPLREISEAAKRAADLTRQLLTFSRKEALDPQVLDLGGVVANVSKMLRRILGEDIALEVDSSPSLPSVKADLGMIEQVILNLAVNSRDAMPRGGKLRITTSSEMIDKSRAAQNPDAGVGRHVCLTFADTGCGIAEENLPRIFEPFFTTKELDRGTGLGLATVYGIIKQHHGWIDVSSRPNEGTTFRIYLPASAEKGGAPMPRPGEQRVIGGTETLLVVEDEAPLLKLIEHILGSYGYEVLGCSNGKAALEIWEQHRRKIDLLLTDTILPDGMAGPELAEILQSGKPTLKVVYTSGYNSEKLAKDFGFDRSTSFIQKPFHARKLAETVYDCLNPK